MTNKPTDKALEAVGRLRAWIRDYGHEKQPAFIEQLTIVLDELVRLAEVQQSKLSHVAGVTTCPSCGVATTAGACRDCCEYAVDSVRVPDDEDPTTERFTAHCPICNAKTQQVMTGIHERDSSMERTICQVCGARKYGMGGGWQAAAPDAMAASGGPYE